MVAKSTVSLVEPVLCNGGRREDPSPCSVRQMIDTVSTREHGCNVHMSASLVEDANCLSSRADLLGQRSAVGIANPVDKRVGVIPIFVPRIVDVAKHSQYINVVQRANNRVFRGRPHED